MGLMPASGIEPEPSQSCMGGILVTMLTTRPYKQIYKQNQTVIVVNCEELGGLYSGRGVSMLTLCIGENHEDYDVYCIFC